MPPDQLGEGPLRVGGPPLRALNHSSSCRSETSALVPRPLRVSTCLEGTTANFFPISAALRRSPLYGKLPGAGRLLTTFLEAFRSSQTAQIFTKIRCRYIQRQASQRTRRTRRLTVGP